MPRFLSESELFPAGVPGLTSRFVALPSGLRVRVVEGSATVVDAPPVLLLPGWGCSAYLYRHNIGALAAAGFRPIAVELKGQGLSDKPAAREEYTLDSLTAHVLEVLDALGLERAMLVGVSLGGAIATRVALRAPDRVTALVLLNAVGLARVRLVALARLLPGALAPVLPRLARRWMFALALRAVYGDLGRPTRRDVDQYYAPARDPAFVRSLWWLLHEIDWRVLDARAVRALRPPVLAISGTRDRLIPPRGVDALLQNAPDAQLVLIAGAGHAVVEEAPEAVNRAVIDFLVSHRVPAPM
ncbi:MAG: alpha/beta hydrolase [Gemmatimonadaceae bacterium]|nr:alpha/beta hydrolase [Gemmatimonadaceae bacterium]